MLYIYYNNIEQKMREHRKFFKKGIGNFERTGESHRESGLVESWELGRTSNKTHDRYMRIEEPRPPRKWGWRIIGKK